MDVRVRVVVWVRVVLIARPASVGFMDLDDSKTNQVGRGILEQAEFPGGVLELFFDGVCGPRSETLTHF